MPVRAWRTMKLCQEYNVLSINQYVIKLRIIEAWKAIKIEKHPLKSVFEDKLSSKISTTHITTRGITKNNMRPIFGNKQYNESFLPQAIKLWNQAPISLKESKTIQTAKKESHKYASTFPI